MNDDFGFSRWAVLFPILSLIAFVVATVLIFKTPSGMESANERRILYMMVAFLGLSALIQGNALFQVERRVKALAKRLPAVEEPEEVEDDRLAVADWAADAEIVDSEDEEGPDPQET